MKVEFVEPSDCMDGLIDALKTAELIRHPDTENTYAAYQFVTKTGLEVWFNARNKKLISIGRAINRY